MFLLFYKFLFFLSDFLEIQRKSFYSFLNSGLGQPFRLQSYFLPIDFLYENYKFTKPTLNVKQSILFGKTYCCHFYIPIQSPPPLLRKDGGTPHSPLREQSQFVKIKWILLGTLPLLTRRGHFIINGTPRIVLNQIVRSTGIYFQKGHSFAADAAGGHATPHMGVRGRLAARTHTQHTAEKYLRAPEEEDQIFYAEIILKRGSWIQFEIDSQKKIWISQQNKPRFFLSPLLSEGYGSARRERTYGGTASLGAERALLSKREQQCRAATAVQKFNALLLISKHFSEERLYLGKNGRNRLNKKLGLCLKASVLTPIDILTISNILLRSRSSSDLNVTDARQKPLGTPYGDLRRTRVKTKVEEFIVDDIDNLKNRRLKTIGELLQDQLIRGLQRLQNTAEKYLRLPSTFPQSMAPLSPQAPLAAEPRGGSQRGAEQEPRKTHKILRGGLQPINSTFKEFFHSHQLSQYLDQSNPLSEITHKRRLSCGVGGADAGQAFGLRSIHQTHYGRICPIETPEGKNAGLVNSLTTAVRLNSCGFLETPFLEVYKQHLQNQKRLSFLSVEIQEKKNPFFNQKFPKQKTAILDARAPYSARCKALLSSIPLFSESQGAIPFNLYSINYLAKSAQQFLSIATTCIPFIEHNDANRALMGSNMQRQALPLLSNEAPLLSSSTAFRVLSDLKDIPTSPKSGFIMYVSKKKILLLRSSSKNTTAGKGVWGDKFVGSCSQARYITFQQLQYNVD